jgi:glycosyltransferase involved in cell wall biosynthesis
VFLAGKLTAMVGPGGGEVQMQATATALTGLAVDACMWRPWEHQLAEADVLHLFGSHPEHLPLVRTAYELDIPVVLSTIAWFDTRSYWAEPRPLMRRLVGCAGLVTRAGFPRFPSWRRELYHAVDLLLPNSQAEAEQLVRYFGVPSDRIHVVPNGADTRFASTNPEPFIELTGLRNFALCVGRIEPRKNQLGLIQALKKTRLPTVLVGDPAPGHEAYLDRCRQAAGNNVRFQSQIDHDEPLLASAYAACGCLVLASWYETPGLAALEAGMSGAALVLTERGAAKEYFGQYARYVRPNDPRGIEHAVRGAMAEGRSSSLAEHVRANFSWDAAARVTLEGYFAARKKSRARENRKTTWRKSTWQ